SGSGRSGRRQHSAERGNDTVRSVRGRKQHAHGIDRTSAITKRGSALFLRPPEFRANPIPAVVPFWVRFLFGELWLRQVLEAPGEFRVELKRRDLDALRRISVLGGGRQGP